MQLATLKLYSSSKTKKNSFINYSPTCHSTLYELLAFAEHKEDISKLNEVQTTSEPTDIHCKDKQGHFCKDIKSFSVIIVRISFKISSFVSQNEESPTGVERHEGE